MSSWRNNKRNASPVLTACPRKCKCDKQKQVVMVQPESVGFTPQIARAAQLDLAEQIFFCQTCGCVWRRLFDTHHFKFHDEILGEFVHDRRASKLEPASWIVAADSAV